VFFMLCHLITGEPLTYIKFYIVVSCLFDLPVLRYLQESIRSYLRIENLEAITERARQNCYAMHTFLTCSFCITFIQCFRCSIFFHPSYVAWNVYWILCSEIYLRYTFLHLLSVLTYLVCLLNQSSDMFLHNIYINITC
jgi:hypothetical protein